MRTIKDALSDGRKLEIIINHLVNGGEIKTNGYTIVWLDHHVVKEEKDEATGEVMEFVIHGPAYKAEIIDRVSGTTKAHYIGCSDLSIMSLMTIADNIEEADWIGMTASIALRSMNKKRD